jgi:hypothetical protein
MPDHSPIYDFGMPKEQIPDCGEHMFVTQMLDESSWASVLATIVTFLRERSVDSIRAEFGFALARDLRGETTPEDCMLLLDDLEALIQRGFQDGTIEWGQSSDFHFIPVGLPIRFVLCNDTDVHFWSPDRGLLLDLSQQLSRIGVRVYDSGNLVETDDLS